MNPSLFHVLLSLSASAVLAMPMATSFAQTPGQAPIISGAQLTEENLIEGLKPADEVRTRSLKLVPGAQQRNKAQRRSDESGSADTGTGSASLLITFETNATTVSSSSIAALDKLARALKSEQLAQYKFDIEGHADPRGSPEENLRLSQGRAESVIGYLVTKHGLDSNRLRAIGKGDREPLNTRDPSAPENRRVTVRNQSSQ